LTDWELRDQIIEGLAACLPETDEDAAIGCEGCPYGCSKADAVRVPLTLLEDVRALLKALKPRVLTRDEVSNITAGSLVWIESIYYNELKPAIVNHANNSKSGVVSMTVCDMMEGVGDLADYGKSWRCWTSEPSSEQRKEVG